MRFFLAFLTLLFSTPASAQTDGFYPFRWHPEPVDLPDEPVWVKKLEMVVSTTLRPSELYVTDSDFADVAGKLLLPQGAKMLALHTDEFIILCNFTYQGDSRFVSAKKRICIEDMNRDGDFDNYYVSSVASGRNLMMHAPIRKRRKELAGQYSVSQIDPGEMTDLPTIAIHYERILDAGNFFIRRLEASAQTDLPKDQTVARFFVEAGGEDHRFTVIAGCEGEGFLSLCTDTNFPSEIDFWGLKLILLERENDNVRMKFEGNFKPVNVRY